MDSDTLPEEVEPKEPYALEGTYAYDNWRAKEKGDPLLIGYETILFTDAQITGHISSGCGPYSFLNTVPGRMDKSLQPSMILRVDNHLIHRIDTERVKTNKKTDDSKYHGGGLDDEICALISLLLGIRVEHGGIVREFNINGDPKGSPVQFSAKEYPILRKDHRGSRILPSAEKTVLLNDELPLLLSLPLLSSEEAIALIRAARMYQESVWLCESNPEHAWLFLISAIETAAGYWKRSADTPVDRMRASRPELESLLLEHGDMSLVEKVAVLIADYMGSTKKFVDFLINHLPSEPESRVEFEWGRIDWPKIKKPLAQIYAYRSKALHSGIPFPAPMCQPPNKVGATSASIYVERPTSSSQILGSSWEAKDLPMYFHIFEYIARGALLKWWKELAVGHGFNIPESIS